MRRNTRWWHAPDHFGWLSGYLQSRDLTRSTQVMMALISASLTLYPANAIWGTPSIDRTTSVAVGFLAGIGGIGFAVLWLTRWPSKRQSIAFVMFGSGCIAAGCLLQSDPLIALMSCSALAMTGGYLAFFHTAPYMVINFAVAVVVGAFSAIRLGITSDALLAATAYFLVVELNTAVPLAIQVVVRALGIDLLQSDRDPLTGLLNRRALQHAVVGVLMTRCEGSSHLALAMIDLDQFKAINDSRGHAVGDATLVAVGQALREMSRKTAVIGRIGGEEFLVADPVATADATAWGERLCGAIAAIPFSVTASVGTATIPLSHFGAEDVNERYRRLLAEADAAMYAAKRNGGNQARGHRMT
jgi:diguanylate cyclase (GGDEF)-like protein